MSHSFPKAAFWSSAAALLAAALYSGAWFFMATTLRTQAELWFEARQQDGVTITSGAGSLTGFPGRIGVTFPGFTISAPPAADSSGAWSWRSKTLRLFMHPLSFQNIFVDLHGSHTLTGLRDTTLVMTLAEGEARFTFTVDRLTHATLDISGLVGTWQSEPEAFFSVEKATTAIEIPVPKDGALPVIHTNIAVTNVTLPDVLPQPLSRTLQNARVDLDIKGPVTSGSLPEVLDVWRRAGGDMDIRGFEAVWSPISAMGDGTIALDRDLQPMGAFTAKVRGFLHVVDMLVADGRMKNSEASIARGVLSLLAKRPSDGAEPELSLAVTVQDRTVYAGPVTLMELPAIKWHANVVVP